MRHPNIVEFHQAFAFEEHTYVVLELCPNGSLMEMIKRRHSLSLPEVRRYMIQLCGGVKYLHRRSVLHRDLKIGNLFLDQNMNLRIGDFGLAAILLPGDKRRQTLCGTPNYIAPEILDKDRSKGHDHQVDTWAIGVICFALLTGAPPFASKTQPEIYSKLRTLTYKWGSQDPNYYPPEAKELVAWCLSLNADKRPEMDDLVEHVFFKMGAIADRLDPSARNTEPKWLLQADPRGDRVSHGYGVSFDLLCADCGVGRLGNGKVRPSTGENASKSAMIEVEAENAQGLAPVVPLAPNVIYRHFSEARESWEASRRRQPILGRKEATSSSGATVVGRDNTEGKSLVSAPSMQMKTVNQASAGIPRPSFAATQRQQALPTRSRKATQPTPLRVKADEIEAEPRKYMQERPVRAGVSRVTRSNSSHQDALSIKAPMTKSSIATEGSAQSKAPAASTMIGRPKSSRTLRGQVKSDPRPPSPVNEDGAEAKPVLRPRRYQEASLKRTGMAKGEPAIAPKPKSKPANVLPAIARQVRTVKDSLVSNIRPPPSSSPRSTSSSDKENSWEISKPRIPQQPQIKNVSIGCIPGSRPNDLLAAVEQVHSNLRPGQKGRKLDNSPKEPKIMVEKWVDYTKKFGLAYILGDGTVGYMMYRDGVKAAHKSVLIRGHKMEAIRHAGSNEPIEELPPGCEPVEIYERGSQHGLQRADLPATEFPQQDRETHKIIQLCDRFGRYIANRSNQWAQEELVREQDERRTDRFVQFFQRLGNVLIWCFGPSPSFQFNFPDHTKINISVEFREIEFCYYASNQLDQMSSTCIDPAGFLDDSPPKPLNKLEQQLVRELDIVRKITWIRGVLGSWINEGAAGKLPSEGQWHRPYWPEMTEKLTWITVGLD